MDLTDNELLFAISDIVGNHIQPLKNEVAGLKERLENVEQAQQRTNQILEEDIQPRL